MNKNEQIEEDLALATSKKKKKLKSISLDVIVKQVPAMPSENSPRHSGRRQKDEADLGESSSLKQKKNISEKEFDLARVKTEPKESQKKKKHSKTKTCWLYNTEHSKVWLMSSIIFLTKKKIILSQLLSTICLTRFSTEHEVCAVSCGPRFFRFQLIKGHKSKGTNKDPYEVSKMC